MIGADVVIGIAGRERLSDLLHVHARAFPDEDLSALVADLMARADILSLAAWRGETPLAHAVVTLFTADGTPHAGALLGPLAVVPDALGQGLGRAPIAEGLRRLAAREARRVFVLGDPAYYVRSGFMPKMRVEPPYALPEEWVGAWQSLTLADAEPLPPGPIRLPDRWMRPRYRAP